MPHYMCAACRIRCQTAASPTDLVGDLCPGCGSLLEPVAELASIVGFRSIMLREVATEGGAAGDHASIADRLERIVYARAVALPVPQSNR